MAPPPNPDHTVLIAPFPVPDPTTTPALTASVACRVVFGLFACALCSVPLRLLHKNGEFAATVFVANLVGLNCLLVINTLIWHDDNTDDWWAGYGWCDVHPYIYVPMLMIQSTSILAITRNLAEQVGLLRANPLTVRERRRKNLVQALIMFPLPLLQIAWMYPMTAQRYVVTTLVGCEWRVHGSWPWVLFYLLPAPVCSLVSGFFVVLTYVRYRELRKTTRGALSSDSTSSSRQNRTKRRLYLMCLVVLIPYIPVNCAVCIYNLVRNLPLQPFDFYKIHHEAEPFPWNSIVFIPSTQTNFVYVNTKLLPIITSGIVWFFFGTTTEAMGIYRRCLLAMGLGKLFPRIHHMGLPPEQASGVRSVTDSWGTQADTVATTTTTTTTKSAIRELSYQLTHFPSHSSAANNITFTSREDDRTISSTNQESPAGDVETQATSGERSHPSTILSDIFNSMDLPCRYAKYPHAERPSTPLRDMLANETAPGHGIGNNEPTIRVPWRDPFLLGMHLNLPTPLHIHMPSFDFLMRRKKRRSSNGSSRDTIETAKSRQHPGSGLSEAALNRPDSGQSPSSSKGSFSAAPDTLSVPRRPCLDHSAPGPSFSTGTVREDDGGVWGAPRHRDAAAGRVSTRVWSDDEEALVGFESACNPCSGQPISSSHFSGQDGESADSSAGRRGAGGVTVETKIEQQQSRRGGTM